MAVNAQRAALVLAPETPYPLAGGGALRTASILHGLARTHAVDLIVFREPGMPHPARDLPPGLIRRITVLELAPNRRDRTAKAFRNAVRLGRRIPPLVDRFSGFEREVAAAVEGSRYDVGVIEHFWCAPYHAQLSAVCTRVALDLHNIESVLHARCSAAEGGFTGFLHHIFEDAARDLELTWLPRFSEILATSEPDARAVRAIVSGVPVTVYPNAIPWRPVPRHQREHAVVFSGNMEYHPNVSALRFFREAIWPLVRAEWPELVWRLVGKNAKQVHRITGNDPRIQVIGEIEDAVAELARAQVAVVPVLAGSGTRLKILEAWAAGLPVVSTPVGAEGLPARDGENMLLAADGPAFARAVSRVLAGRELGEKLGAAGRLLLEKEFTWEAAWKKLPF